MGWRGLTKRIVNTHSPIIQSKHIQLGLRICQEQSQ